MTMVTPDAIPGCDVDIQWGLAKSDEFPEDAIMVEWAKTALASVSAENVAVSVRMMARDEIAALNRDFRDRPGPTNVLSFPADGDDEAGRQLMGDIAICPDVVLREANEQYKTPDAHMAHMLVHGVLHLAGYDHVEDDEAEAMERLEVNVLNKLGFPDPYRLDPRAGDHHE